MCKWVGVDMFLENLFIRMSDVYVQLNHFVV